MVRTFEIKKNGEGFTIAEQAGSDPHRDAPVFEAKNRHEAAEWLRKEGGAPDLVDQALLDAASAERTFLEVGGSYSEVEDFPKR